MEEAVRLLNIDDFSLTAHREIFAALLDLVFRGERVLELSLLAGELRKRGTLEAVGGEAYLVDLDRGVVPERKMESRRSVLREFADRRKVVKVAEEAIRRGRWRFLRFSQTASYSPRGTGHRPCRGHSLGFVPQSPRLRRAITLIIQFLSLKSGCSSLRS
jgi:hypothetical protein